MIKDYIILEAKNKWDLREQVIRYLGYGYRPVGSVALTIDKGSFLSPCYETIYTQAMIKEEPK